MLDPGQELNGTMIDYIMHAVTNQSKKYYETSFISNLIEKSNVKSLTDKFEDFTTFQ
jgi:hypothetical protein